MTNMLASLSLQSRGKFRIVSGSRIWSSMHTDCPKIHSTPLKNPAFGLQLCSLDCPWFFGFKFAASPVYYLVMAV